MLVYFELLRKELAGNIGLCSSVLYKFFSISKKKHINKPLTEINNAGVDNRRLKGFSLLEVLVSLMILMFITLISWYTFDGIARIQETVENSEAVTNSARVSLARLSKELRSAFLTRNPSPTSSYLTLFRGNDMDSADELVFTTFSHIRLYRESQESDESEITYFTVSDPDAPGLMSLMHRESNRIDGKPDEGGHDEILARRVLSLNFRYYDDTKQEWLDSWDSVSTEQLWRMPRAVEVSLVLVDLDGQEHHYGTTILLPMYRTKGGEGPLPPSSKE